MEATYRVEGMTCGGCADSVTRALQRLGVKVEVSLERKEATVKGDDVDDAKVKEAVEAAGYDFGGRVR
jgi:copper chaperone